MGKKQQRLSMTIEEILYKKQQVLTRYAFLIGCIIKLEILKKQTKVILVLFRK